MQAILVEGETGMMTRSVWLVLLLLIVLLILFSSVFVVREGSVALLYRFEKQACRAEGHDKCVYKPGLHFKLPFIDREQKVDLREQLLSGALPKVLTSDDKDLTINYYVVWRISDVTQYVNNAEQGKGQINEELLAAINKELLKEYSDRSLLEILAGFNESKPASLIKTATKVTAKFGVTITGAGINRLSLSTEDERKILSSMENSKNKEILRYKSQSEIIIKNSHKKADEKAELIIAQTKAKAEKIKAEGDTIASKIYADAYNQDLEFYKFYRSMKAYKNIFKNSKTVFVLQPDSQFFKYFDQLKLTK